MSYSFETPLILPLFESSKGDAETTRNYQDIILRSLKKILPSEFFESGESEQEVRLRQKKILQDHIPLITYLEISEFPEILSFFALSKYRSNSFKFFFEMISRWLAPGKRLNVVLVCASDFRLVDLSDEIYTICEIMIQVSDREEFEQIRRNFPIIGTEIVLGIHSEFYSQRILEIKGLSADDKTAMIQGFIAFLVKRFPQAYDQDVFTEMQHVLVTCRDDFKAARQSRHLSRIIGIQYLFRKSLREAVKKKSDRRYLNLKIFRAQLKGSEEVKRVLGVIVGVNFLKDQETFGDKHLVKALQHYIPSSIAVEDSFFIHKLGSESICIAYIEIEKKDGGAFTSSEIRKLRRELPANLKNRVEHRLHPVFMPRNEEEVMRNILTLSSQIKYVRDIPQVLINFDEQADAHLYFTVIMARILKSDSRTIAELFRQSDTFIEYVHDRTKETGFVRNKYVKEASVFKVKLPKERFLRSDHSIDLYKARQVVVNELVKAIGEIRDYNGGMISKQHELFSSIRHLLIDLKDFDEFLFENFFYSLSPVVARTLLDPGAFKSIFLMLNEGIKEYKQESYYLKLHRDDSYSFALIIAEDVSIKDALNKAIKHLNIPSVELATAQVKTHGNLCLGYICGAHEQEKRDRFFPVLQEALKAWEAGHSSFLTFGSFQVMNEANFNQKTDIYDKTPDAGKVSVSD